MHPWLALIRATMPAAWPAEALRLTFAPPPAAFGPFAPWAALWAPVWAVAFDAARGPRAAAGGAFGPFVWALHLGGEGGA